MAYLWAVVLLAALFGCLLDAQREDLKNSVVYAIQPPPELPCNPFINEQEKDYGNIVLQCYVMVSRTFLKEISGAIDIRFYSNLNGETTVRRGILDTRESDRRSYIIFEAVQSVKGTLKERDEYWCQVLVNGRDTYDSVMIQRSSVTVIRMPSCYEHLLHCTEDIPLGHSAFLDALFPSPTPSDFCEDSERASPDPLLDGDNTGLENAALMSMSCNRTTGNDESAGPAVIVPSVLLAVFVVLALLVFAIVLGMWWKRNKTNKNDGDINGQHMTDCEPAQLRHARSLPNLLCSGHSSTNGTSTSAASAGCAMQTSNGSGEHMQKLLDKLRGYHKRSTPQSKGSRVEGDYTIVDISPRIPSRTSESYMYVTPNPINFPVQGTREANNLQLPTTQPGTYLTLVGSRDLK